MKKSMVIALLVLLSTMVRAQTWQEWFAQKETQIRYLQESMAALRAYAEQVEKGYTIAREGLSAIGRIKDADWRQHEQRIASLSHVNTRLKEYGRFPDAGLVTEISRVYNELVRTLVQSRQFSPPEIQYHNSVYQKLLEDGRSILQQMAVLLQDGTPELSDEERLRRLEELSAALRERNAFARQFAARSVRLALQHYRDAGAVKVLRRYHSTPEIK